MDSSDARNLNAYFSNVSRRRDFFYEDTAFEEYRARSYPEENFLPRPSYPATDVRYQTWGDMNPGTLPRHGFMTPRKEMAPMVYGTRGASMAIKATDNQSTSDVATILSSLRTSIQKFIESDTEFESTKINHKAKNRETEKRLSKDRALIENPKTAKIEKRRAKNRITAQRCREKKNAEFEQLVSQNEKSKREKSKLLNIASHLLYERGCTSFHHLPESLMNVFLKVDEDFDDL